MMRIVSAGIAILLLTVTSFAQSADKSKEEQDRARAASTTITGCLTKGDTAGQYMLTDNTGAKKNIVPSSGVDLDKHAANHTVKLTGTMSQDGQTFTATNVEHVSSSCEAAK